MHGFISLFLYFTFMCLCDEYHVWCFVSQIIRDARNICFVSGNLVNRSIIALYVDYERSEYFRLISHIIGVQ